MSISYNNQNNPKEIILTDEITDLSETTWILNDYLGVLTPDGQNANRITTDEIYSIKFKIYYSASDYEGLDKYSIGWTNTGYYDVHQIFYTNQYNDKTYVYVYDSTNAWKQQYGYDYKTIYITGGSDKKNTKLINWLKRNATLVSRHDINCIKYTDDNNVDTTIWSKPISVSANITDKFGTISISNTITDNSEPTFGNRSNISNTTTSASMNSYWGDSLNITVTSESVAGYDYTFQGLKITLINKNHQEVDKQYIYTENATYNILSSVNFNYISIDTGYTRAVVHYTLTVKLDVQPATMFNSSIVITKNPTGEVTTYTQDGTYDLTRFSSGNLDNIEYSYTINGYPSVKSDVVNIEIRLINTSYIKPDNYTFTPSSGSSGLNINLTGSDIAKNQIVKLYTDNVNMNNYVWCSFDIHTPAQQPGDGPKGGCDVYVTSKYSFLNEHLYVLKGAHDRYGEYISAVSTNNPNTKYVRLTDLRPDRWERLDLIFEKVPTFYITKQ